MSEKPEENPENKQVEPQNPEEPKADAENTANLDNAENCAWKADDDDKPNDNENEKSKELFVRHLCYETTEEKFKEFYSKFGKIVKASIPQSEGRRKGIGFLEYETKEEALRALESSGKEELDGWRPTLKWSSEQKEDDTNKTAYVANLSFDSTEESIKEFFKDCGPIKMVRIAKDTYSGKNKGFAHVVFESVEGLENALKLNGNQLNGREIKIDRTKPKEGGMRSYRRGGPRGRGRGSYRGGYRDDSYRGRGRGPFRSDRGRGFDRRPRDRDYQPRERYETRNDRDRERDRDRDRERDRERDRSRDRYDEDRRRDRDYDRDRDRYKERNRSRSRSRDRDRDRERDRDRDHERRHSSHFRDNI